MEDFSNKAYLDMELLRFTTAGSVDDGKSTLIGRLLYDSKSIFEDQLDAVKRDSIKRSGKEIDLALLTDGLRAEREQGITIDVAYRYFATPKRKFIVADTPGHIQYTRNMVTGASTANAAIILIDARNGVLEQTYRHTYIASLLKIPHVIFCINKMDLVGYSEEVYERIKKNVTAFTAKMEIAEIRFIPISALKGDNVVEYTQNMKWWKGPTLLHTLENLHIGNDYNHIDPRFTVQYVVRPQDENWHDYRGYAGRVSGGVFKVGDEVVILPSGFTSKIKTIELHKEQLEQAFPPMSVTFTLEDDIDISRGDMIVRKNNQPEVSQDVDIMLCWMSETPLKLGKKYSLKHTTKDVKCIVKDIIYKVDISTLDRIKDDKTLKLNEIARVVLRTTSPLFFDSYRKNRLTGSIIMIDDDTNVTVGAGMIK